MHSSHWAMAYINGAYGVILFPNREDCDKTLTALERKVKTDVKNHVYLSNGL